MALNDALDEFTQNLLLSSKPPKFPEGTRVMLKPQTVDEANAGWEQPEGRVVVSGVRFYVVLLDEEFRPITNPDGYVDVHEDALEKIECK